MFVAGFSTTHFDSTAYRKNALSRSSFLSAVLLPCVQVAQKVRTVGKSNSIK